MLVHKLIHDVVELTAAEKLVLKTHIEGSIRGRSKSLTHFTDNILRPAVVIAHGILNLHIENDLVSTLSCLSCIWAKAPASVTNMELRLLSHRSSIGHTCMFTT